MKFLNQLKQTLSEILTEHNYIVAGIVGVLALLVAQYGDSLTYQRDLFLWLLGVGVLTTTGNYFWDLLELSASKFKDPLLEIATYIVDEVGIKDPLRGLIIGQIRTELANLKPDADLGKKMDEIIQRLKATLQPPPQG